MSERHVTVDIIIAAVSAVTGVHRIDMLSDRRDEETARARFAALWLATKMIQISTPALGRAFGDRDHTTILYALRRAEELRVSDRGFRVDCDTMLGTLLAIERHGLIRLAQTIDPLATARRVLSHPAREAVRVSTHEIVALCQVAVATLGEPPPEPSEPASQPDQETDHAA
jgi:hypothetical protein